MNPHSLAEYRSHRRPREWKDQLAEALTELLVVLAAAMSAATAARLICPMHPQPGFVPCWLVGVVFYHFGDNYG